MRAGGCCLLRAFARVVDQNVALRDAIDAQRLIVEVRFVPVVEEAVAAADRRAVAPRRPREPDARHQVQTVADVRLHLVPHADAERELAVQPDVVRPVEAHVVLRERGVHLAEALGERDGPVLVEGLNASSR